VISPLVIVALFEKSCKAKDMGRFLVNKRYAFNSFESIHLFVEAGNDRPLLAIPWILPVNVGLVVKNAKWAEAVKRILAVVCWQRYGVMGLSHILIDMFTS
jgi:hypothetical protein